MTDQEVSRQIVEIHNTVRSLMKSKLSDDQIIDTMKTAGHAPHYVETVIQNIRDEVDDKKNFRNSMIMGLSYLTGGGVINIMSYRISDNLNGTVFYLFWGIIVLGVITIIRGFILYRK